MEPSDGRGLVSRTPDPRDQAGSAVPFQGGVHQAGPQPIQRSLVRARREVLGTGNRLWACASRSRSIRAVCVSYHCIVRGSRADLCSNLGPGSPSSGDGSRLIPLFRPYQQSNKPARVNGPGFQGGQFHTSRFPRAIGGEGGRLECLRGCVGGFPGRSAGPGLRSQGSSGEDGVFALRARGEGDRFPSSLRPDPAARVGCLRQGGVGGLRPWRRSSQGWAVTDSGTAVTGAVVLRGTGPALARKLRRGSTSRAAREGRG